MNLAWKMAIVLVLAGIIGGTTLGLRLWADDTKAQALDVATPVFFIVWIMGSLVVAMVHSFIHYVMNDEY